MPATVHQRVLALYLARPCANARAARSASGTRFTRLRDSDDVADKTRSHLLPCARDGFGLFEDARVGDEPPERRQARPAPTDRRGTGQAAAATSLSIVSVVLMH